MSRQIALDSILLKPTPRWGHTEYSLSYHHEYIRQATGLESSHPEAYRRLLDLWEIDLNWGTNDGLRGNWGAYGRSTNMGHAVYAADGSDLRQPHQSPFQDVEEVWAFDAVKEYGLPDFDEQVAAYEKCTRDAREGWPNQLTCGGYYKSIISGAIQAFGWDMLLEAAADRAKMEKVFDSIYRYTRFHMEAWAKTSVEVIIQHDDFVWTAGAFMHPEVYRKVLIPRYGEMWKILHAAGKKVLFCSDGNFMEFAEDLAAAGADGFIFEPDNDLGFMVERFGQSHCLVGSCVDCRDLAFSPWEKVKATIDRTVELAAQCKGFIWAVGNNMPANIPPAMMAQYIEYVKPNLRR